MSLSSATQWFSLNMELCVSCNASMLCFNGPIRGGIDGGSQESRSNIEVSLKNAVQRDLLLLNADNHTQAPAHFTSEIPLLVGSLLMCPSLGFLKEAKGLMAPFPPCFGQFFPSLVFALCTGKHTSVYPCVSCEKTGAQLILLPTPTLERAQKDLLYIDLHI